MRNAAGIPQGKMTWAVAPMGGGGYCTHIEIANDGTMVTQSDVFNSFVKGPSATSWTSLFRADTLSVGQYPPANGNSSYQDNSPVGGYATAIAPSNSQHIYACYDGYWWHSSNQGTSWTKIGGPYVTFSNSGDQRLWSNKAIVDPQNPLVAMLGTEEGKIIYVTDGATPNVLTVAAGAVEGGIASPHLVAVDPSSSVSGGIKQKWAYSVHGTGIYQSTTGPGGPYTLLSGSPASPCSMMYDAAGNLWALQYIAAQTTTGNNIYKKTPGGSFANLSAPTYNIAFYSLAVNPSNTSQIAVIDENGTFAKSEDGGATWGEWAYFFNNVNQYPTAVGWMTKEAPGRFFPANIYFHPTNGRLYASCGVGIRWSVPPSGGSGQWNWVDDTLGIENLEVAKVLCPPGGNALYVVHDFGVFPILDEKRWLNKNHIPGGAGDSSGWFADYAPTTPSFIVLNTAFFNGDGNTQGYSTDYGATWTKFTGTHPSGSVLPGGVILAASTTDFYWFPSNNVDPAESHDGGATWTLSTFPGVTQALSETGWGFSQWNPQFTFCVDKTNGDAYAYNYGPTGHTSQEGIYYRQFGTGSWVKQGGRPAGTGDAFASGTGLMMAVPGRAGELFYKGNNGGALYRSTNKGVSWTAISNVSNMVTFCFGKSAPGQTYPCVYINGAVSGVSSLWRSDDGMTTWVNLGQYPMGHLGLVQQMDASKDVYGKLYLGTDHGGGIIGTYDCPITVS